MYIPILILACRLHAVDLFSSHGLEGDWAYKKIYICTLSFTIRIRIYTCIYIYREREIDTNKTLSILYIELGTTAIATLASLCHTRIEGTKKKRKGRTNKRKFCSLSLSLSLSSLSQYVSLSLYDFVFYCIPSRRGRKKRTAGPGAIVHYKLEKPICCPGINRRRSYRY